VRDTLLPQELDGPLKGDLNQFVPLGRIFSFLELIVKISLNVSSSESQKALNNTIGVYLTKPKAL
jgi:hypothetical protein